MKSHAPLESFVEALAYGSFNEPCPNGRKLRTSSQGLHKRLDIPRSHLQIINVNQRLAFLRSESSRSTGNIQLHQPLQSVLATHAKKSKGQPAGPTPSCSKPNANVVECSPAVLRS